MKKPQLHLLSGAKALDVQALSDFYVKLTGKKPTRKELAEAKQMLANASKGKS